MTDEELQAIRARHLEAIAAAEAHDWGTQALYIHSANDVATLLAELDRIRGDLTDLCASCPEDQLDEAAWLMGYVEQIRDGTYRRTIT